MKFNKFVIEVKGKMTQKTANTVALMAGTALLLGVVLFGTAAILAAL